MLKLLVFTTLLSACLAQEDAESSAAQVPVQGHHWNEGHRLHLHRQHSHRGAGRHNFNQHDEQDNYHPEEDHGPLILRTIRPHDDSHPNFDQQNRIIEHVYSPDYAEPTWVLDYRYLKSGGRDYTRGPGGQILILPKGIRTKERKQFSNYDELIEHLKVKTLEERQKPFYFMPTGDETIAQNLGGHWKQ